jgi:peroxiredoxin
MLQVGQSAPEFELPDIDRQFRRLTEFKGKIVILAFYPGAFTDTCIREMCTLRDSLEEFNDLDGQVIGISVNDPFSNKGFTEAHQLTFPLLSDYLRKVVKLYGVTLEDFAGLPGYTVAQRAVFIIDRDGTIQYIWIAEHPGTEPDYREVEKRLIEISG